MQTVLLGSYILIWPVGSLAVMMVILAATLKDMRQAKRENREVV